MAIDFDPFCVVCGGPFSHVDLLDFSQLDDDQQSLKETAYNTELLPFAQIRYISCFKIIARTTNTGEFSGLNQLSYPAAFISDQGAWQYDGGWERRAPNWVTTDGSKRTDDARFDKFFPLHAVCADILQRFVQHASNLSNSIAKFIDACTACQQFSKEEHGKIWRRNMRDLRPPDYDRYGCVEWSHLYFGARRFWSDPWDCQPGQEYLCTDPTTEPKIDEWIIQCLASSKSSSSILFSSSTLQSQLQSQSQFQDFSLDDSLLMRCPTEILRLIASHLPLRSAINLHASSRRLSAKINESEQDFWHSHTLRLHSAWFWELGGHQSPISSTQVPSYPNWKKVLMMLTQSRGMIMKGAQPWWLKLSSGHKGKVAARQDKKMQENALLSLPLSLRNRQRIWMCLEDVDVSVGTLDNGEDVR